MMDAPVALAEIVQSLHSLNQGGHHHWVLIIAQNQDIRIIRQVLNGNHVREQLIYHQHMQWEIVPM
jgi:hypothetical protein